MQPCSVVQLRRIRLEIVHPNRYTQTKYHIKMMSFVQWCVINFFLQIHRKSCHSLRHTSIYRMFIVHPNLVSCWYIFSKCLQQQCHFMFSLRPGTRQVPSSLVSLVSSVSSKSNFYSVLPHPSIDSILDVTCILKFCLTHPWFHSWRYLHTEVLPHPSIDSILDVTCILKFCITHPLIPFLTLLAYWSFASPIHWFHSWRYLYTEVLPHPSIDSILDVTCILKFCLTHPLIPFLTLLAYWSFASPIHWFHSWRYLHTEVLPHPSIDSILDVTCILKFCITHPLIPFLTLLAYWSFASPIHWFHSWRYLHTEVLHHPSIDSILDVTCILKFCLTHPLIPFLTLLAYWSFAPPIHWFHSWRYLHTEVLPHPSIDSILDVTCILKFCPTHPLIPFLTLLAYWRK